MIYVSKLGKTEIDDFWSSVLFTGFSFTDMNIPEMFRMNIHSVKSYPENQSNTQHIPKLFILIFVKIWQKYIVWLLIEAVFSQS